jgi:hypothetical protein
MSDGRALTTSSLSCEAYLNCQWAGLLRFAGRGGRLWLGRSTPAPQDSNTQLNSGAGLAASGTIFISYSSDDLGAAKRLFTDLQEIGGDVAWFDKSALKPGDNWDQQLRSAVQRCSLFLPLLSSNTEQRTEGYFRLEWNEAAERSKKIQGKKFIFPIVIDADYAGAMGRYALVPEAFRAVQYCHAPGGQISDDLKNELREQLRTVRRARAV